MPQSVSTLPQHPVSIHNTTKPRTKQTQYLGVLVGDGLTFIQHVASLTGKASSKLWFLRRNVQTSLQGIKAMAYNDMICPTLEYASAACSHLGLIIRDAFAKPHVGTSSYLKKTLQTSSFQLILSSRPNHHLEHPNLKKTHTSRRHNIQYWIPHCLLNITTSISSFGLGLIGAVYHLTISCSSPKNQQLNQLVDYEGLAPLLIVSNLHPFDLGMELQYDKQISLVICRRWWRQD